MFSLLAWPRALVFALLFITFISYSQAREQSLFTSSVTYCNPPETILIQRFEVAYFPSNSSVSFNISAASVQANVNVTANLYLNVYGMSPVNVTLDLCNLLGGALCPLPMYNFTGADSLTLPSSLGVVDKIPGIAYIIPDLEGFAQLTLTEVGTGSVKACIQATLSNGWSAHQEAVEWSTGGVALGGLLAAGWFSLLSPEAIIPFRLLELMCLYQSIAASAFLNVNYPSVYRAFALNFAWAVGLLSSEESALQNSINRMRHLTGGKLADANGGSAVGLVNRKLSPYNKPSTMAEFTGGNAFLSEFSSEKLPSFSKVASYMQETLAETIKGEVQTVTDDSSNVLQAGVPIYVNSIHIATANAFMTVFIVALAMIAIALAIFGLGYGAMVVTGRARARKHKASLPSNFDYRSFVLSWFLRLALVIFFPFIIFIFYQWTLKDSWLSILLSVISFLAIGAAIIYPSFRTLSTARRDSPHSLYTHDTPQLNVFGSLYVQYRAERYWFFIPMLVAVILRAIFIAFAKGSGEVQVALLLVVELSLVLVHFILKPAKTKGSHVFTTYLSVTRMVATGLMIAFLEPVKVAPIPRVVIGIIVAIIWSVSVLVVVGNIFWHICVGVFQKLTGKETTSSVDSPAGSEGSILEKGIRGDASTRSDLVESGHTPRGGQSEINLNDEMYADSLAEVARARPLNPTPDHSAPADPYIFTPYPISPTGSTVTTMDPPSLYSRDSGTITVGSLLPRRWSFSMSQPGSPAASSTGHGQRGSLISSSDPTPSSSPSESSHSHGGSALSRNTSMRLQQHQLKHEDIQEEVEPSPIITTTTSRPT